MPYFLLVLAAVVSTILTPLVAKLMRHWHILDLPKKHTRKIHREPVPLGGGVVIALTFFGLLSSLLWTGAISFTTIATWQLSLIGAGAAVLVLGGLLDDAIELRPQYQIIFPIIASGLAVLAGIAPQIITNPLGGTVNLNALGFVSALGLQVSNIVLFVWLMGMMFTTKFLDGLDGLVTGMVGIGAIIIYLLTQQPQWWQPEVGMLAQLLAGSCLGFLVWNWHPAKIFLGEGGSLLTGYLLAVIAVISGSKIITTLLVMGVPALDVVRVMIMRYKYGKSLFVGDSEHLHFKLINSGLSQRQAVGVFYSIGCVFGLSALFLSNGWKLIAFSVSALLLVWLATHVRPISKT